MSAVLKKAVKLNHSLTHSTNCIIERFQEASRGHQRQATVVPGEVPAQAAPQAQEWSEELRGPVMWNRLRVRATTSFTLATSFPPRQETPRTQPPETTKDSKTLR